MRLTKEQIDKLINHLSQYGDIVCPVCKGVQWNVNDLVIESREFLNGDVALNGTIMPFIPLTCRNCGNTLFLNAVQLGYVNKNKNNGNETEPTKSTESGER